MYSLEYSIKKHSLTYNSAVINDPFPDVQSAWYLHGHVLYSSTPFSNIITNAEYRTFNK